MSNPSPPSRYEAETVYDFVHAVLLGAGVEPNSAALTARGLWSASIRGVDSHGIRLLPHYVEGVRGGRINPNPVFRFEQTSYSTGKFDADHGFGHAAGIHAMRAAMSMAQEAGSGNVAVRNSSHCGSMAYFALEACAEDMIGTAYTNATPKMRTPNATSRFFGTNPVCYAAPMANEEPFCYDGSTTLMSANKIRVFGDKGLELPAGAGANEAGNETRIPSEVTQLLPIGDYKGFGIAMMVDMMCGLLSGMPAGDEVTDMFKDPYSARRNLGQYYSALRIDTFEDPNTFKLRMREIAYRIRALPQRNADTPVQVPGDPEKAAQAEREDRGIPIGEKDWTQFQQLSESMGVALPTAVTDG